MSVEFARDRFIDVSKRLFASQTAQALELGLEILTARNTRFSAYDILGIQRDQAAVEMIKLAANARHEQANKNRGPDNQIPKQTSFDVMQVTGGVGNKLLDIVQFMSPDEIRNAQIDFERLTLEYPGLNDSSYWAQIYGMYIVPKKFPR